MDFTALEENTARLVMAGTIRWGCSPLKVLLTCASLVPTLAFTDTYTSQVVKTCGNGWPCRPDNGATKIPNGALESEGSECCVASVRQTILRTITRLHCFMCAQNCLSKHYHNDSCLSLHHRFRNARSSRTFRCTLKASWVLQA